MSKENPPPLEPPVTGGPPAPTDAVPAPIGGWKARIGIVKPLAIKDFRLLWLGMTISMIGDGIYFVAIAWQVLELENAATALAIVGLAFSLPMVVLLLFGGVISDRFDRRRVMILSDFIRGAAIASVGVLSVMGVLELWHVYALVAVYGAGEALFAPAFGPIIPELIPSHLLVQANSLQQFVRPFAVRLAGPALGGVIVAVVGPGQAFLIDGATFGASALCLYFMSYKRVPRPRDTERPSMKRDVREGFAYVKSQPWLWGTLLMAALGILFFAGPSEVLLPYLVKNRIHGTSRDLGWIFAAGGVGAIVAAIVMGQRGLPRRHMTFLYSMWALGTLLLGLMAFSTETWHAMLFAAGMWACFTLGMIVWGTLMNKLVPRDLQGRVTSLDWLVSLSLMPVSFALTGWVADRIGAVETLLGGGVIATVLTLAALGIPGILDTERNAALDDAAPLTEQDDAVSVGSGAAP